MVVNQSSSARVRRDAASRAMQGWHAHRLLANGTHGDNILKVIEFLLLGFTFDLLTVVIEKDTHFSTGQRFNTTFKS